MDLSALVFKVDDSELVQAVQKVDLLTNTVTKLANATSTLNKATSGAANAARQQIQADEKAAAAKEKVAKASKEVEDSGKRSTSVLEKQQQVLEYMTQGYSRGQASMLATAKSAGALSAELEQLAEVLVTQRKLMGTDPFDKSIGALQALKNEYTVLKETQRLFSADLGLTKTQMQDLAREKLRLIEKLKLEGASLTQVKDSIMALNSAYLQNANAENAIVNNMKKQEAAANSTAKANSYIEQELGKLRFALSETNKELTKSSSNALLKFQQALTASGKPMQEQIALLKEYEDALKATQNAGKARMNDYITRAVAPQITDIVVGLSTGQSPLTVLLQQGGQLRDQFSLAGVAAGDMANVMRTAAKDMMVSIKGVSTAIVSLLAGGIIDAGEAFVNFVAKTTGVSKAMQKIKESAEVAFGPSVGRAVIYVAELIAGTFAIAVSAAVAGLTLLGTAGYQLLSMQKELTVAFAGSGAALGLNAREAKELAISMQGTGVSILKASDILVAAAKNGDVFGDSIKDVIKVTADLETYTGASIQSTIDMYGKLGEKPADTLLELAKRTGLVNVEVIKNVKNLEDQGKMQEAVSIAQEEMNRALGKVVTDAQAGLPKISLLWIGIKKDITGAWDSIIGFLSTDSAVSIYATSWNILGTIFYSIQLIVKQTINVLSSFANYLYNLVKLDFSAASESLKKFVDTTVMNKESYDAYVSDLWKSKAAIEATSGAEKAKGREVASAFAEREKALDKYKSKEDKMEEALTKAANRHTLLIREGVITEKEALEELAIIRAKFAKKGTQHTASSSLGLENSNEIALFEQQFNREIQLMKRQESDKAAILKSQYEAGVITRTQYASQYMQITADSENSQKSYIAESLQTRQDLYDKETANIIQHYQTRELMNRGLKDEKQKNIEAYNEMIAKIDNASRSYENFKDKASDALTSLNSNSLKRHYEALKAVNDLTKKATETYKNYSAAIKLHKEQLDNEREKQDLLRFADPLQTAIIEAQAKEVAFYATEISKLNTVMQDTKNVQQEATANWQSAVDKYGMFSQQALDAYDIMKAANATYNAAATNLANARIDQTVAKEKAGIDAVVKYGKDEFKRYSDAITDVIVTAMTEGGQSASKKMRSFLVNELKKQLTLTVQPVVNLVLNSLLGNVVNGAIGSAVGSTAGSSIGSTIATSIASSAVGKTITNTFTGIGAAVSEAGTAALASFQTMVGMTGTAAQSAVASSVYSGSVGASTYIGAAMPYVAAALLVANAVGLFRSTNKVGGGLTGTLGQGDIQSYDLMRKDGTLFSGPSYSYNLTGVASQSEALQQAFKQMREASVITAESFGASSDSIKNFTTTLGTDVIHPDTGGTGIKFDGLTAEQAAQKIQEALTNAGDKLNLAVISSMKESTKIPLYIQNTLKDVDISNLDPAKATTLLNKIIAIPDELMKSLGISSNTLVTSFVDEMKKGSAGNVGKVVADLITSSIENQLLNNAATQIIDIINRGVITPIITAMISGQTLSQALQQESIKLALDNAKKVVDSFNTLWNNDSFKELMQGISTGLSGGMNSVTSGFNYTPTYVTSTQTTDTTKTTDTIVDDLLKKFNDEKASLTDKYLQTTIEGLKEVGETAKAEALEKQKYLSQFDALSDIQKLEIEGMYNATIARDKELESIKKSKELRDEEAKLIQNVLSKYLSQTEYSDYQYGQIAQTLVNSGLNMDVGNLTTVLKNATMEDVRTFVQANRTSYDNLTQEQKNLFLTQLGLLADLKTATDDTAKKIQEAFKTAGTNIVDYLQELTTTRAGLATPMELLAKTKANYQSDLSSASGGDSEAAGRLVDSAKKYIDAQKAATASSDITNTVIKSVIDDLKALGFVQDALSTSSVNIPQFANGGVFTNGIVSKPTLFNTAQMGEAGSEAVMPLVSVGGSLGVRSVSDSSLVEAVNVLIGEVRALRNQQAGEVNAQIAVAVNTADKLASAINDSAANESWKTKSIPELN